jgi:hypothetical protein
VRGFCNGVTVPSPVVITDFLNIVAWFEMDYRLGIGLVIGPIGLSHRVNTFYSSLRHTN